MARPCKICNLKKDNPKAYKNITDKIEGRVDSTLSMAKFVKKLNDEFSLGIIEMNVSRHKAHYLKNKLSKKPSKKKKSPKKPPAEMEVYSKEGELLYTNIQEIIDDLEDKEKLFCEAYVNTHNHNGTSSYMQIYQTDNYGSAAVLANKLLKKVNVQLYLSHLMDKLSKSLKVSSSFVITGLMTNYSRCMQADQVMGRDGEPIGIYNYNANAANKALELIGKHIQMWDKKDIGNKEVYQQIIEKLLLNQISPINAGLEMGKHNLPVPDALKIAMQKVDPKMIEPPKGIDADDLDVSDLSDEELDQLILQGA